MVSKITSKGQITLPAKMRAELDLTPGDKVEFIRLDDGSYKLFVKKLNVESIFNLLTPKRSLTLDEIEENIAKGARQ
ncbi:MAG: AbrB/MazE/SpoVT family DNA-binding domain-containing protein [Calditrichaeota bacterium]|nr:MAG: AbrB/MazE/SpoVT family DNA-binding domain-containing protein [Calditrichota bacterium]